MSSQHDDPRHDYSRQGYGQPGDPWAAQYWTRGFSPLFRGMYSDQHLRVSDAERQAVTDRLAQHFADGRLDQAEFDARVEAAVNAKTRADLSNLFTDLPETGAPAAMGPAGIDHPYRRRGHPVLMLVLFVIVASAFGHLLWWTAGPIIWLAFLVFAVLFASRTIGHARARHHDHWL
jgi:hypothetical protein